MVTSRMARSTVSEMCAARRLDVSESATESGIAAKTLEETGGETSGETTVEKSGATTRLGEFTLSTTVTEPTV